MRVQARALIGPVKDPAIQALGIDLLSVSKAGRVYTIFCPWESGALLSNTSLSSIWHSHGLTFTFGSYFKLSQPIVAVYIAPYH